MKIVKTYRGYSREQLKAKSMEFILDMWREEFPFRPSWCHEPESKEVAIDDLLNVVEDY